MRAAGRYPWLFSAPVDLAVFGGSAALAFALLAWGAGSGELGGDTPEWTWVPAILLIDVAHVWATGFRVYLDPVELRQRFRLYLLVPVLGWAVGVALYSESPAWFWRSLAYMAVYHFVRQQYGWVMLYRARGGENAPDGRWTLDRWIDALAIYAATVYPLLWWHANLPRNFWWFLPGDFASLPTWVAELALPLYVLVMGAYVVRSIAAWRRGRGNPGKDLVVATTAACWYIGIVAINSDYAFTVTNVIIHGVPYFALIYWYGRARLRAGITGGITIFRYGPYLFLGLLWIAAYAEELLWHRAIWHDRTWLFGSAWDLSTLHILLVPLLALPQLTHYILDGFIWRRRTSPDLTRLTDAD